MYLSLSMGITPLSSSFNGYNVKLPFLMIGIFLVLRNEKIAPIIKRNFHNKNNQVIQYIIFVMALIGVLTGSSIIPVLLDYIAISFFFFLFKICFDTELDYMNFKKFVKGLFATISLLELLIMYLGLSGATDDNRFICLTICPFFMSIVFLNEKRMGLSIFFFSILAYMTIRCGMRVNYIVVILYILYFLYTILHRNDLRLLKKISSITILIMLVIVSFPIAQNYIESDASRNLHMVTRFTNMFDSEQNEEATRIATNKLIITHTEEFIFPHGIGWLNHIQNIQAKYRIYGVLSTMDSNLLYCVYHFGLFFGLYIMMKVLIPCLKGIISAINTMNDKDIIMSACLFTAILSMFILKSWIFVYTSFGIIYGILFAYANGLKKYPSK